LKLENLEENLSIEYKNYVTKDDKLFLGWIVRFLNQNWGDFRKFLDNFLQNARNEIFTAISVVLFFYVSIFQFFDNNINPSKI
jgi:hypothetical protein